MILLLLLLLLLFSEMVKNILLATQIRSILFPCTNEFGGVINVILFFV